MKEVTLSENKKYLIDSDGIKFKRPESLATIEVKVSSANLFSERIDTKKDFIDAIKNFPETNAYLSLGLIPRKLEMTKRKHPDSDVSFMITCYRFYKVELYHLGL